jgi:hypothetical protein
MSLVKTSSLAVILAAMIISVTLIGEADGAGLVWRAVNKLGSLVSDLGDVAGGCSNGEVMKYQTSNSTWICGTDSTGSGISNIVSAPATTAKLIQDNSTSSTKVSLKTLTQGTGITITNGTSEITIASSVVDTDTTNIVSAPATTAKLIQDNSTSSTKVSLKTLTEGTGITITNGTSEITIASSVVDTGITSIASGVATANNATLIADNSTLSNQVTMKTLSSGLGITLINNTNTVQINVTNGINLLTGNLTTSAGGTDYTQVFRIPLSANTGNMVHGILIATSAANQAAIQVAANITNSNTGGFCFIRTGTTTGTTAPAIDNFVMNSSSITLDTAEPTYNAAAQTAVPIFFDCTLTTSSTPGDLRIFFQPEVEGSSVSIKAGSWYIKTP